MTHMFDTDIAAIVGVNAAVIFQHILFWCQHCEANGKNYHDGLYWTYSSNKAFREIFPYMSSGQIDTALRKLIKSGLIVKGNYNKSAYDRTLWYAVTDYGKSIFQKPKMENEETQNQFYENAEPIPDIVSDISTDRVKDSSSSSTVDDGEATNPYADSQGSVRPEKTTVQRYASANLTTLGARAMDEINSFIDDTSEDVVRHAIDNTLDQGVRAWSYARSILNRYVDEGVKTVGDAKASDERFRQKRQRSPTNGGSVNESDYAAPEDFY